MKTLVITVLITLSSTLGISQEAEQDLSILSANENWGKEIIKFPIEWAPKLKLQGFEELRFAPFWSHFESDQFWSLVIAWKVNAHGELATQTIEDNFEAYFDGLMTPNHWATTFSKPTALFLPNLNKEPKHLLIGKMKLFDGFHTGKVITLNIKVEQHFCEHLNKSIIIFRCSPKNFEHPIWEELNTVTMIESICH